MDTDSPNKQSDSWIHSVCRRIKKAEWRMCFGRILYRLHHPIEYRFLAGIGEELSYMWLQSKCTPIPYEKFLEILYDYGLTIDDPRGKQQPRSHMEFKKDYQVKRKYHENFKVDVSALDNPQLTIKQLAICLEGNKDYGMAIFRLWTDVGSIYIRRKDRINFCLHHQDEKNVTHDVYEAYGERMARNVEIKFKHCIFLESGSDTISYPGRKDTPAVLGIEKNETHRIIFDNCYFRAVALDIKQYTYGSICKGYNYDRIYGYISCIVRNSRFISKVAGIWIDTFLSKYLVKDIEELSPNDRNTDSPTPDAGMAHIHIENCRHMEHVAVNTTYLSMKRKNAFTNFSYRTPKTKWLREQSDTGEEIIREHKLSELAATDHPDIYDIRWSAYQTIRPYVFIEAYKEHMLRLKDISEHKNDKYQADIFRREIAKCDHIIVGLQPFSKSWQDRLTLFVSKYLSNYGISWWRPLVALVVANGILAILYCWHLEQCVSFSPNFWYVFFETWNPLVRFHDICIQLSSHGPCNVEVAWFLSLMNVLHKLMFALCVYEMIRAGRRFTRLEY